MSKLTKQAVLTAQKFVRIGDKIPDFKANTTKGNISYYDFFNKSGRDYSLIFSHPKAHTPVCTTELGKVALLSDEWSKRSVSVLGLSVDADVDNQSWIKEIEKVNKCVVDFPIINDKDYEIACLLGMINPDHCDDKGMPLTARSVFVIDKDHKVRATITYPASTGRNFAEIVRLVDSIRMTDGHKVATPADWKVGDKCIVLPNISTEDAKKMFSNVDEVLPYLRYTKIE